MNNMPKAWITLDERNILVWYRIIDFALDEENNVQVLFACTKDTRMDTFTMTMRQKFPDGTLKGAYAFPLNIMMCVEKANEFVRGVAEGYKILQDTGNVYIPDGVDAIEYMKDSIHFNVIDEASKNAPTAESLDPGNE